MRRERRSSSTCRAYDLDLTFDAGKLSIEGKRGERVYRYAVTLGAKFDPDTIAAQLDKGVLTVTAKLKAEARPRRIVIGAAQNKLAASE